MIAAEEVGECDHGRRGQSQICKLAETQPAADEGPTTLFEELQVQIKTNILCDFRTNADHINHSIHRCSLVINLAAWTFPTGWGQM